MGIEAPGDNESDLIKAVESAKDVNELFEICDKAGKAMSHFANVEIDIKTEQGKTMALSFEATRVTSEEGKRFQDALNSSLKGMGIDPYKVVSPES